MKPLQKKFLFAFAGLTFVVSGTLIAVKFGSGYRPGNETFIRGTGLLSANSFPSGAQVFIDGKLTTATDDTLNLSPGEYQVLIQKDGYIPWQKKVTIEQELVTQTNSTLFPSVVSLTPITQTGVTNVTPSPDGTKLAYIVSNSSTPSENGLYVYHLNGGALTFRGRATQITRSTPGLLLEDASILWSPDSSQLLLTFIKTDSNLLLDSSRFNELSSLKDVSASLRLIFQNWEKELYLQENEKLLLLPEEMQYVATTSAKNIYFSPDEKKMLYTATQKISIPERLIPSVLATNSQPEERNLEINNIYIYDLKEDKNFKIDRQEQPAELEGKFLEKIKLVNTIEKTQILLDSALESSPSAYLKLQAADTVSTTEAFKLQYSSLNLHGYQWFPTSSHLIINKPSGIEVVEYDGTNRAVLYSGPRDAFFVYPWPDGSKLLISTNLGSDQSVPLNLYAITIK